jgi:nitroimidazol reductase NimA-like FMN-containing flavoprotein (pyridoxamine 5'-phosphate oxidase superfamily)
MKKRDLTFKPEIEAIIKNCESCNLAMADGDGMPYVVPMNFGYEDSHIYLHSARTGKKIDIMNTNPRVCISFSTDHQLRWVNEEVACSWGMKYRSVLAYGVVEFIEEYDEKVRALKIIMKHYSDKEFDFNAPAVNDVMVFRVKVDKLDGRVYGY